MDPCFFEFCGVGTSWVSSSVHLVHRPENHFQIICFDKIEENFVFFIESSVGHFFGSKSIRRDGDVINFVRA
jgi:hypothetical protein